MHNENYHPVLPEPPIAHALHRWEEERGILSYEYNGRNIINIHMPGVGNPGFRHGSDGNLQSGAFVQQLYVMLDDPSAAEITFLLSGDAVNIRPARAASGQAILGQTGRPLMHGVNGLYDIAQDLLIEWNGCGWEWTDKNLVRDKDGCLTASIRAELGPKPLFVNLYMHYYRRHLGYEYHRPWLRRSDPRRIAGWCSWEALRRNVSAGAVKEISEYFAVNLKEYGMEYVQIDDGYQKVPLPYDENITMAEGWKNINEKQFPGGHEGIVNEIAKRGFKAGVWTTGNVTNPGFAERNREHFLKDVNGDLLPGEWVDYILDCTPETLEEYVVPVFKMLRECGYEYIKIDSVRHLLYDGFHEAVRKGLLSNDEAQARFRAYMEACRRGMGDDAYFLSSWGVVSEAIGVVDACRISMDANPTWAGVRMQMVETARWFFAQRILFLLDPDHICARTDPEWARSLLSLVSLSGGLYMLSDLPRDYDDSRLDMIRRTLPPLPTMTGETGGLDLGYPAFTWTKLHGFAVHSKEGRAETETVSIEDALDMAGIYPTMHDDHPFSSLWAVHINEPFRKWCVLGRFATVPLAAGTVELTSIGLDPLQEYIAFDFWSENYLGRIRRGIKCKALELGHCQIVSLTPVSDRPQLIASTRHISMDAVSVKDQKWLDGILEIELEGVTNTAEAYWIHSPLPFIPEDSTCEGGRLEAFQEGESVRLKVFFNYGRCLVKLAFARL